ncbi:hypothetical protein CAI21_07760 [Alkalilimnicola ehrlichii]|uniref:Lipoprotein n=1 Tax=Alkalilimnicola ehrlichii TaxID=351052 RepID=A0A3E0WZ43_9GAMM|nr:hypothetical protein [Alkalilimnicola ehrlichii]RFA30088.1 hypothetical protein CAI21_07760 [Alkalilimnicola ehrlichii]RFA37433.1 hypothetical protein CAL65_09100 [Alkalilimnicola ehrlichii]
MDRIRLYLMTLLFALPLTVLVACDTQGPAEQAGEQVDETFESAGESFDEASDDISARFDDDADEDEEDDFDF